LPSANQANFVHELALGKFLRLHAQHVGVGRQQLDTCIQLGLLLLEVLLVILPLTTGLYPCLPSEKATAIRADQGAYGAFLTILLLHYIRGEVLRDSDLSCGEVMCVSAPNDL
jgi:hypothetical protein